MPFVEFTKLLIERSDLAGKVTFDRQLVGDSLEISASFGGGHPPIQIGLRDALDALNTLLVLREIDLASGLLRAMAS